MDFITHVRVWAHLLGLGWFTLLFFLAFASEDRTIRITHTLVGKAAIVLLGAWFALLLLSVRGVALMPRDALVPTLAALEMGGWVLAWVWVLWCGKENYRIELKRNNRTTMLILLWLTVLFLV